MNISELLKGILISILSLAVSFAALALPFKLFCVFSSQGLWVFFFIEILIYTALALTFLAVYDRKKKKSSKPQRSKMRKINVRCENSRKSNHKNDIAA